MLMVVLIQFLSKVKLYVKSLKGPFNELIKNDSQLIIYILVVNHPFLSKFGMKFAYMHVNDHTPHAQYNENVN